MQRAVQLVGPDRLALNEAKPVTEPGPHRILCKVVVVGLCFSDLKLLKQFSGHLRKADVVSGVDPAVLRDLSSYVPGEAPTVPGHEPVVEIVKVGPGVTRFKPGERYFIQADWRWVRTSTRTNGAFGYNFEGALQEYVLLDERIVVSPDGESMLLPAPEGRRSAAAYALVEPWACVENSYRVRERRAPKAGGRMLIVAESEPDAAALRRFLESSPRPAAITWASARPVPAGLPAPVEAVAALDAAPAGAFDDVLYFGHDPATAEAIFSRAALNAMLLFMTGGRAFGRPVEIALGAVHYRGHRLAGTTGNDPAAAAATIPETGEIRRGERVQVVGAGGPMGVMHVIRDLCQGVPGVTVYAADLSDERLAALDGLARPAARENGVDYRSYNPKTTTPAVDFGYIVIMAPVPALVAAAVRQAAPRGIVNIFAGIAVDKTGPIDLDAYCSKGLYFIGTSGSVMDDMRTVLAKVEQGRLDTNVSVAAVSGLDGAVEGIRAVEKQLVPGKIMVYPACRGLGLTPLSGLAAVAPEAAAALRDGVWTMESERALLARFAR
jgi:threonine dehydrogenase-like Zn-dependent dehydrogenase